MLTRKDLRPGDIMCQFMTGSWAGKIIHAGQALTSHSNSTIVHAGVLFDDTYVIEALNKGIRGTDLRIQSRTLHYMVYRPVNLNMARGAADCANMMLKINAAQKTLSYDIRGAIGSIFGSGTTPRLPPRWRTFWTRSSTERIIHFSVRNSWSMSTSSLPNRAAFGPVPYSICPTQRYRRLASRRFLGPVPILNWLANCPRASADVKAAYAKSDRPI